VKGVAKGVTTGVARGVVVGAGFMGRTHASAYLSRKDARIVCIVDRDREKAEAIAEASGCEVRSDLSQALSDWPVDFVDVCLPSTLHRQAVTAALESHAHVLVEKPFAVSLEDVDAMIQAAGGSKKRLMVAHVCRFMPQYQYLKKTVEGQTLGKPLVFHAWRLSEAPAWSWNNWLNDKAQSGGTLLDLSIHDLDVANWLFGVPQAHDLTEISSPSKAGPAHTISRLAYPSVGSVTIEASHLMPKNYPFNAGFRLVAEKGTLEFNGSLNEFTDKGMRQIPLEQYDPYETEIHHFLDCLASGEEFRITPQEARLAVATVIDLRK
jgi:predicted dehydrogenase